MIRFLKKPEILAVVVGLIVGALIFWWRLPGPPVLSVTSISNFEFHDDLQRVGFDRPQPPGAFRALTWDRPVRAESDVTDVVRALDLTAAALASGPHTDLVSAQSSIHVSLPVLNTIIAWSNANTDVWLLRQRYMVDGGFWRTYGIVQDKTVTPNIAFYFGLEHGQLAFRGSSCFICHASGPRFIRPIRPDLISGEPVATAFNGLIAGNSYVETHFSVAEPPTPHGPALTATACVSCHRVGDDRAPLYHIHDESIRALVAIGAMPRHRQMLPAQWAELQAWLADRHN